MKKVIAWIPKRRFLASGLAGIFAFFLIKMCEEFFGYILDESIAIEIGGFITLMLYNLLPDSGDKIAQQIDRQVRTILAEKDAEKNVEISDHPDLFDKAGG